MFIFDTHVIQMNNPTRRNEKLFFGRQANLLKIWQVGVSLNNGLLKLTHHGQIVFGCLAQQLLSIKFYISTLSRIYSFWYLTGADILDFTDVAWKPIFKEMIEIAKHNYNSSIDYLWRNPATKCDRKKASHNSASGWRSAWSRLLH